MSREMLNLKNAAEHVHMDANELRHVAQRGEIEFDEHGGDLWFEHRVLDEWAQRNLLASGHREQLRQHGVDHGDLALFQPERFAQEIRALG